MARVRIVCKTPPAPVLSPGVPKIAGFLPDLTDTTVTVVKDDGTEEKLEGVTAISWHADLSGPVRAYLTVEGAELDAVGVRVLCGACEDAGWIPLRGADGTLFGASPCKRCQAHLSDPQGALFLTRS